MSAITADLLRDLHELHGTAQDTAISQSNAAAQQDQRRRVAAAVAVSARVVRSPQAFFAGAVGVFLLTSFLLVYFAETVAVVIVGLLTLLIVTAVATLVAFPALRVLGSRAMPAEQFWDVLGEELYKGLRTKQYSPDQIVYALEYVLYERKNTRALLTSLFVFATFAASVFVGKDWVDDVLGKWARTHAIPAAAIMLVALILLGSLFFSPVWYLEHPLLSVKYHRERLQ